MKFFGWIIVAAVTALIAFAVFNWQGIFLGVSMLLADERPELIKDAGWNDPASAQKFNSRFGSGVRVGELIAWLRENEFAVNGEQSRADRRIQSLPCNENIEIEWQVDKEGLLSGAKATITEAGCL
jgi:hypothetical protein